MSNKKGLWHGLTYTCSALLVLSVLGSTILEANKSTIDSALGTQSTVLQSEDGDGLYTKFVPKDEYLNKSGNTITGLNTKAFLKAEIQMGRRAGYEGSVLLKNTNNALPLTSGSSVTLLGKRSHTPIMGSGMGVDAVGQYVTLETALGGTTTNFNAEKSAKQDYSKMDNFKFDELSVEGLPSGAGAGYKLNQAMIERYEELKSKYSAGYNDRPANYKVNEVPASEIADVSLNGYKDAAIVVVGRPSAESGDFAVPAAGQRSILALTEEEQGIVKYATDNFNKVIVIVNTNSPMEIEELKTNDKIGAILWVGHPGNFGNLGIADILCGRVSPSGGLADTYAVDSMSSPAMKNFGSYAFTNPFKANDLNTELHRSNSNKYVIEAEGMYTGYHYYETRYFDSVYNQGNAKSDAGVYASKGNWNYAEEVSYTFGYGLSYSNFKYEIESVENDFKAHEKYTTFNVKVTNTGSVAAATPVEIYAQAPYKKGGVEKSAIQLGEFEKTKILAPGASETVSIEVDWQNIASYDMNYKNADGTTGNYILDNGDYYFAIGNGAHEALNNILALQGKTTADGMDANGDKSLAYKYTYQVGSGEVDGSTFSVSRSGYKIQNQIPYSDWNYYEPGKVTYLSRSDWKGTYPIEYKDMTAPKSMINDLNGLYYNVKKDQDTSDIKWGDSSVELNFYDLALMPYDDPRWEEVLNKMTIEDAITMAAYGGNTFAAAESVGFKFGKYTENTGNGIQTYTPATSLLDDNCPWKVDSSDNNGNMSLKVFGSAVLVASSFSHDLLYAMGEFMGQEAIIVGLPIIWGPGGNTHRMPYNGRTGEYYSEDPILTGIACMEFAVGGRDNGLIASPKHYAFNDQETNRNGVAPFLTEQRAREVELRAFQIAFEATPYDRERGEDTGMLGMMTSFSKVGAVECTSSWGMLNGIAVGEWGFHGYTVTDINDDFDLFDCMLIAGCTGYDNRIIGNPSWATLTASNSRITTLVDGVKTYITKEHYDKDRDLQVALKNSVHRTLYTFCQSVMMNQFNSSTKSVEQMTWWRAAYMSAIGLISIATVACAALYIVNVAKKED